MAGHPEQKTSGLHAGASSLSQLELRHFIITSPTPTDIPRVHQTSPGSIRHPPDPLTSCVRVRIPPEGLDVLVVAVVAAGGRAQVVRVLHRRFRETAPGVRVVTVTRRLRGTGGVRSTQVPVRQMGDNACGVRYIDIPDCVWEGLHQ